MNQRRATFRCLALLLTVLLLLSGCALPDVLQGIELPSWLQGDTGAEETLPPFLRPTEEPAPSETPELPTEPAVTEPPTPTDPPQTPETTPDVPAQQLDIADLAVPEWDGRTLASLAEQVPAAAAGNDWEALWSLWEQIMDEYDKYDLTCTLQNIRSDLDPRNELEQQKVISLGDEDAWEQVCDAVSAILASKYRDTFLVAVDCARYESLDGYDSSAADPAVDALYDRANELVREYDDLDYGKDEEITVQFGGRSWNMNQFRSEGDSLSQNDYFTLGAMLEEAQNAAMGPVLVELINVRNQIAKAYGWDNYYDMGWETDYWRDYSWQDYLVIRDSALKYLFPLEDALYNVGYDYNAYMYGGDGYDWSLTDFYAFLSQSQRLPEKVRDAFGQLADTNAVIFAPSTAREGYYTALLAPYGMPVIYWSQDNCMYDMIGLSHEGGHAISAVMCKGRAFDWNMFSSIDLSEVQSQSSTLLLADEMAAYRPELADDIRVMCLYDVVSTIPWQCIHTDVERALYTNGELTLEKANQIATAAVADWNYVEDYCYADMNYDWVTDSFIADSPVYTESYVVSAAASLALWLETEENEGVGLQKYLQLQEMDSAKYDFREALEILGLDEIFTPAFYEKLDSVIRSEFLNSGVVYFTNNTGVMVESVYVSPQTSSTWGHSINTAQILPGETVPLFVPDLTDDYWDYDIAAVDANGLNYDCYGTVLHTGDTILLGASYNGSATLTIQSGLGAVDYPCECY